MDKNTFKQYTIRNIPIRVDRVLRHRAKQAGKSFNEVAVEALALGAGQLVRPHRDFSFIINSLSSLEATGLEAEIKSQRQIDPKLWPKAKK